MGIENCISDCDLPLIKQSQRPQKRRRQANLPPPMTIGELGGDLLVEILIRLPNPRFACRCKLVSKRWSSLISSPRFNRRFVSHHQAMSLKHPPLPDDPYELQSIILGFLPPMHTRVGNCLRVLDCNKDLVLCGFWDADCGSVESSRSYLVCNPFTKQWVALPLAPSKSVFYESPASRLVCEPRVSIKLDLGDGQAPFVYSEYRFRVVCMYQALPKEGIKLDVFCSESGEWTKEAFSWDFRVCTGPRSVISCNGELFWRYVDRRANNRLNIKVARFNPFRLDMPPTPIDVSPFVKKPQWFISNSQGALHVIALENETLPAGSSVWRLEEDRKSWRKRCEGLMNKTSTCCNYEAEGCGAPFLHPHKPELVFFSRAASDNKNALMCCDLRSEELQFFAKLEWRPDIHHLQVFQPTVSCWATPIPRCKQLQGMCNRSSFRVESSSEANNPSHHFLNNCMDRVLNSTFYKDYIEHVISEASLNMLAEVIQLRRNKIGEIVFGGMLVPRSPDFDSEWDVLLAASNDVGADRGAIVKQKAELKQALMHEMAELPYPPPGPIKSFFWREPSCGGLKPIVAVLLHGIRALKREGLLPQSLIVELLQLAPFLQTMEAVRED